LQADGLLGHHVDRRLRGVEVDLLRGERLAAVDARERAVATRAVAPSVPASYHKTATVPVTGAAATGGMHWDRVPPEKVSLAGAWFTWIGSGATVVVFAVPGQVTPLSSE